MNKIINLSHNDLDGVGCNIVLHKIYDDIVSIHTSYNDIQTNLDVMKEAINNYTKLIFITDLNFKVEDFKELFILVKNLPSVKFIYIDHHQYDLELLKKIKKAEQKLSNFKFIHTVNFSATYLTYKLFDKKISDKHLEFLALSINGYDLWKKETPYFKYGFMLNILFWKIGINSFKSIIIRNNYRIPNRFKKDYKNIIKEKEKYFKVMENKGLIQYNTDIFFGILNEHISFVTMDYQSNFYIILNPNTNNISVRISDNISENIAQKIKDSVLETLSHFPGFIGSGGHLRAFGITFDKKISIENMVEVCKACIGMIERINNCKN